MWCYSQEDKKAEHIVYIFLCITNMLFIKRKKGQKKKVSNHDNNFVIYSHEEMVVNWTTISQILQMSFFAYKYNI